MELTYYLRIAGLFFLTILLYRCSEIREGSESLKVVNLRCESLVEPIGVDIASPRLSWSLQSDQRNKKQLACQIIVADDPEKLLRDQGNYWNSGKLVSGQCMNVAYGGKLPDSGEKLYWKVKVWDETGKPSEWSPVSSWEMGLMDSTDWKGRWIGLEEDQYPDSTYTGPAPYLRRPFKVKEGISSAKLYISGLGYYELWCNGQKIGDQELVPAQTNYDKRKLTHLIYDYDDQSTTTVLYNTYDLTQYLQQGDNALGVILGNGWYNQRDRTAEGRLWYDTPRMIAQLELQYSNGLHETIVSNGDWLVTTGPLLHDQIFTGEVYDARLALGNWTASGYDDTGWQKAKMLRAPTGKLKSQMAPTDKIIHTYLPVSMDQPSDTSYVFDVGQMISGWISLRMHGEKGTKGSDAVYRRV